MTVKLVLKKSPIHENTNAKITCDFGDERFRSAAGYRKKQRINARVALIFKSIIMLLIIFLGFIKSKPC